MGLKLGVNNMRAKDKDQKAASKMNSWSYHRKLGSKVAIATYTGMDVGR